MSQLIIWLSPYGLPILDILANTSFVMAAAMILCPSLCSLLATVLILQKILHNCLLLFKSCLAFNSQFFLSCNYKRNLLVNNCNFINILQLRFFFYQKYLTLTTYSLQWRYKNKLSTPYFKKEKVKKNYNAKVLLVQHREAGKWYSVQCMGTLWH